jgi:hypothetical protein
LVNDAIRRRPIQATKAKAPTHRATRSTTILKNIANTFDMNAMVGRDLHHLKMPRPAAYGPGA